MNPQPASGNLTSDRLHHGVLFLEINGFEFTADEADATVKTLALAERELSEAKYAAWLKANPLKV